MTKLLATRSALPGSGREATSAFVEGDRDVLLSYENEAILAKQNGQDIDYVVPDDTLLIENPAAVTEDATDGAQDFLDFLTRAEAPGALRRLRLPPGRSTASSSRGRGRQRPGRPVPGSGAAAHHRR